MKVKIYILILLFFMPLSTLVAQEYLRYQMNDNSIKIFNLEDVDSITHELRMGEYLTNVHSSNKTFAIPADNILDVSIGPAFSYKRNYADSLNALFYNNDEEAFVVLFGEKEISLEGEMPHEESVLMVSRINMENMSIDAEETTVIVVDSLNYPKYIINKENSLILKKVDDSHLDCFLLSEDFQEGKKFENIEINNNNIRIHEDSKTRSFGNNYDDRLLIKNALDAVVFVSDVCGTLGAKGAGKVASGMQSLGDGISLLSTNSDIEIKHLDEIAL